MCVIIDSQAQADGNDARKVDKNRPEGSKMTSQAVRFYWNDIKDSSPYNERGVLVATKHRTKCAFWSLNGWCDVDGRIIENITHWAEFPDIPDEHNIRAGRRQFYWQRKTEEDRTLSKFTKELIKLCEKYRLSLFGTGEWGIEIYESGEYPQVDMPTVTGIRDISFDPDEGANALRPIK